VLTGQPPRSSAASDRYGGQGAKLPGKAYHLSASGCVVSRRSTRTATPVPISSQG
jgi:hypothetical protein